METKKLPGLLWRKNYNINGLMVPFTYGCNKCPAKPDCGSVIHLQENPVAIRGAEAGSPRCLLTNDPHWAPEMEVLQPQESNPNILRMVVNSLIGTLGRAHP